MTHSLPYTEWSVSKKAKTAVLLCTLGFLTIFVFREILLRTVKNWATFDGAYGLLILVISLFMIWNRKKRLTSAVPSPAVVPGLLFLLVGAALQLAAILSNTLMLQGIALIITLLGLVWMVLGWSFLRLLVVPIVYLAFMFSFFEELLGLFSNHLQLAASHMAGLFLKILGIPVFVSGEFIQMPHIILEVAKVCNGVNHIISLVALAIPIAVLMFSSNIQKVALVALAFFFGIFANALRVTLIGLWTIRYGKDSIHGPFEFLYVSFILVVGIVFIGMVTLLSRKMGWSRSVGKSIQISEDTDTNRSYTQLKTAPIMWALAVLAALVTHQTMFAGQSVNLNFPLDRFPVNVDQWQGRDVADPDWPFKNLSGDQLLRRIYARGNGTPSVGLTIAYFTHQDQDKEVINQRLMWLHLKAEPVEIDINNNLFRLNRGEPRGIEDQTYDGDNRIFYFFYSANGKVLTDPYKVKFESMRSQLFEGTSEASLVVFSTENKSTLNQTDNTEAIAFMTAAIPLILPIISNGQFQL